MDKSKPGGSKQAKPRKEQLRFDMVRDVALLEEVREMNPFASELPKVLWETISTTLNERLNVAGTARSYTGRLTLLLAKHQKNETASLRRLIKVKVI